MAKIKDLYAPQRRKKFERYEVTKGTTGKDMMAQIDDPKNPLPGRPVTNKKLQRESPFEKA